MARNHSAPRTPRASRLTPAERRAQILAAARRVLEVRSIEEMSVESVATEAGVSPGLLFHYFGSQRTFREAILQAAADELLDQVRPDPALSPAEQITTGILTFTDYVARFPAVYRAVTRLNRGAGVRSLHRTARATMAKWLWDALADVGAPPTPALELAVAGWLAYAEEVVLTWLDQPTMDREALADLCERSLYQLLGTALNDDVAWKEILRRIDTRP